VVVAGVAWRGSAVTAGFDSFGFDGSMILDFDFDPKLGTIWAEFRFWTIATKSVQWFRSRWRFWESVSWVFESQKLGSHPVCLDQVAGRSQSSFRFSRSEIDYPENVCVMSRFDLDATTTRRTQFSRFFRSGMIYSQLRARNPEPDLHHKRKMVMRRAGSRSTL
jgi:hypothetical protein